MDNQNNNTPNSTPARLALKSIGRLRAAVLGANDGIVSTTCLILGVAASSSTEHVVITGIAALAAGALSMAVGEYVSVHSQEDMEQAALVFENKELHANSHAELDELTGIYIQRGLDPQLARQVAIQLTQHNALKAHARDELGINTVSKARPIQAAISSALSFSAGALIPIIAALCFSHYFTLMGIACASLVGLAILGFISARAGGARALPAVCRITGWSALAMAVTYGIGSLLH